jgi:hypothetical protein
MNPPKKVKLHQRAEELQEALGQQQSVHEFATVEDMLRHDALHTPVPPSIAHRLQESASQLTPPQRRAWWRRIFGGPQL